MNLSTLQQKLSQFEFGASGWNLKLRQGLSDLPNWNLELLVRISDLWLELRIFSWGTGRARGKRALARPSKRARPSEVGDAALAEDCS